MTGINVSADGRHTAAWLRSAGADAVRIVLEKKHDLRDRFREYRDAGVFILGVFARESIEGFSGPAEALAFYRRRYGGLLGALQVGNESDLDSPSSWTMSPRALTNLGWIARSAFPDTLLICAGMASGQPDWLADVDLGWANICAVHPYAKDATPDNDLPEAWDLVREYWRYGLPVWITEWGWWGDEERGEQEVRDMVQWAVHSDEVKRYFHFCADDAMVPPFGLYRADGSPKPAAHAFAAASAGFVPAPDIDVTLPKTIASPWIGDGLQKKLDELGWTATTDEHDETLRLVRAGEDLIVWNGSEAVPYRRS